MTDWQKGDLALCIKGARRTERGAIYTVAKVIGARGRCGCGDPLPSYVGECLWLEGVGEVDPTNGCEPWASSSRFRKVTPPIADEFDREVIDLMAGKKVPA